MNRSPAGPGLGLSTSYQNDPNYRRSSDPALWPAVNQFLCRQIITEIGGSGLERKVNQGLTEFLAYGRPLNVPTASILTFRKKNICKSLLGYMPRCYIMPL